MSNAAERATCLSPETLAAFAEGKLSRSEAARVVAHAEGCPRCMSAIESAHHIHEETAQRRRWPYLAVAAALATALPLTIPAVRTALFGSRSSMSRLVASAPRGERLSETRLSGGFEYAPYRGPARLDGAAADIERMKRIGLAGELADRANREPTAGREHDAGIALLLVERPLEAAERLRLAAAKDPKEARNWSDLAAALAAAAAQLDRSSLYPQALDAADRALRLAPRFPEALFNRALIIEHLGLTSAARDAWHRYLETDPSSPWADEARKRMAKLDAATGESLFDRDRPRLEHAAASGDVQAVAELVARYPQQARTWSEFEYLTRWAGGSPEGLAMARNIGDALQRHSGESLLRQAVRAIDDGDAQGRGSIAEGQRFYQRGRVAYSKRMPTEAERDLREAAKRFAAGRSPMALVARYYAANTRFDRNDVAGAGAELTGLLREADVHPGYAALGAQVRWELALCRMYDGDWLGALPLLLSARSTFERLGERNHLGFLHALVASTQVSLGHSDDAWASRIRAFEILSGEAHGDRLAVSLNGAAAMEIRTGRLEAARALLALEERFDREAKNDSLLAHLYVRRAAVSAMLGDGDGALYAREARAISSAIADPELRAQAGAAASFAEGATLLPRDPRQAREHLTRAIDFYRTSARPAFLPEAYLLRARASDLAGARAEALRDLDSGAEAVDRHRVLYASGVSGMGVIDAGPALLCESIRLRLDMGKTDEAFASAQRIYAQLTPAAEAVSMAELQQRLAGSDAAVLALAVLPHELVAFCITAGDRLVTRQPLEERQLGLLAEAVTRGEAAASQQLYDLLLRPSQQALTRVRSLIVVAPPPLDTIPFAALYDAGTRRFLIESWSVAVAPSAAVLVAVRPAPVAVAVATALPSPRGGAALPDSLTEVGDVAQLYRDGTAIRGENATFAAFAAAIARADVIHVAGHTERDPSTDEFGLTFADQRASWKTIAALKLRPSTVLLSACDTLQRLCVPGTPALSLGGGFLAAGAFDVIGTLSPVRDTEAREIFLDVHRRLAAGEPAAEALRGAQLAAIATERDTGRRGAWRAVALFTRHTLKRRSS